VGIDLHKLQEADWYYNDMKHVGLDFSDPVQVATYDARQKSTDEAAAALLDELGVNRGQCFADFGCGTGVLACQAALKGCQVQAIDISAQMLNATVKRSEMLGAVGIATQQAGFLSFKLPEGSLDCATTQYALHHLNDFWKLIALQRLHATLKPGATFMLRDVVYSCQPSDLQETVDGWLRWMQEERGYRRDENVTHVRDEHSTFAWVMEGLLERAGFQLLESRYARGVYATYICKRPS
jgi:ubiquinone/menaquinone biosynthesis C-methylase UbiE